jgi:hypothetical protein
MKIPFQPKLVPLPDGTIIDMEFLNSSTAKENTADDIVNRFSEPQRYKEADPDKISAQNALKGLLKMPVPDFKSLF